MGHETVIELAAGLYAVVVTMLGGRLLWTTAKLRAVRSACVRCERARAEASAVLDTVPLAAFRWPVGSDPDGYSVHAVAYPKFLTQLARGGATLLEAARGVLQRDGTPLSLTVGLRSGGAFTIEGRRGSDRRDYSVAARQRGCRARPTGGRRSRKPARADRCDPGADLAARPRPHSGRLQPRLC